MNKRIISVFCLLLIVCMILTACGKQASQDLTNSKYLGTWKAVSISFKGLSDAYEDECYLTLNPDGTAVFYMEDEDESKCTWQETDSGVKLTGDSKMTFTDVGDALIFKLAGSELRFELQ